eukprot:318990-Rhodomonas_salina.1
MSCPPRTPCHCPPHRSTHARNTCALPGPAPRGSTAPAAAARSPARSRPRLPLRPRPRPRQPRSATAGSPCCSGTPTSLSGTWRAIARSGRVAERRGWDSVFYESAKCNRSAHCYSTKSSSDSSNSNSNDITSCWVSV